jgi:hypothetical protein
MRSEPYSARYRSNFCGNVMPGPRPVAICASRVRTNDLQIEMASGTMVTSMIPSE